MYWPMPFRGLWFSRDHVCTGCVLYRPGRGAKTPRPIKYSLNTILWHVMLPTLNETLAYHGVFTLLLTCIV
jgi:hypothetical protein